VQAEDSTEEKMKDDDNRCRSCKKPIIWAITEKNKRIPIDPKPAANGNIALVDRGNFLLPLAHYKSAGLIAAMRAAEPTTPLFLSHFATCPDAARFRKK
jgi:hypothetical protein